MTRFNYDCTVEIEGTAPLTFGKPVGEKKLTTESFDEHEERTWREKIHRNKEGQAFIPAMALKLGLAEVAKHLGEKVPGAGMSKYTKHFTRGIMVPDPLLLFDENGDAIHFESIACNRLFVPADGRPGGGKRVFKNFPEVESGWTATATVTVLDPVITPELVERYIEDQGIMIGLLVHRPQNNGVNGRFRITSFSHTKTGETAMAGAK